MIRLQSKDTHKHTNKITKIHETIETHSHIQCARERRKKKQTHTQHYTSSVENSDKKMISTTVKIK